MAATSKTLLDSATNEYVADDFVLSDPDSGLTLRKRTLRCGVSAGVDEVEISNGDFSFVVLPTRGMSVHRAKCGDEFIGWRSPVNGPVHPSFVDVSEPSGLGWLDGFDELLVRCGLESNGAPEHDPTTGRLVYPLHGRIGNKPAQKVTVSIEDDELTLTGVVEEIRFHFLKLRMTSEYKLRLGETGFRLNDTIENLSGSPAEMQMLYHTNFGAPVLESGSQFVAPVKAVAPRDACAAKHIDTWDRYAAAETGFEEQVYFCELLSDADGMTRAMLKNSMGSRGVALAFNQKQLPYLTLWKNTISEADGYVTGIEPGTNFPNPRTFEGEHGRVKTLAAGGSTSFGFQMEYLADEEAVSKSESTIQALQGAAEPEVHEAPRRDWSAS